MSMASNDGSKGGEVICGPGRAKQSMLAETDINNIVRKYKATGFVEHVATRTPVYMDVSEVSDYRDALEQVRRTDEFFMGLPAKLRSEFGNSPAEFLDFVTDPGNRDRMIELGLVAKPVVPAEPVDEVPGAGVQARGPDGRFESPGK